MLTLFASGHLVKNPAQRVSSKGTTYCTATLVAATWDGDGDRIFCTTLCK